MVSKALSEVEVTAKTSPVVQDGTGIAETNALLYNGNIYCKSVKTLAFMMAELEARIINLKIINHHC